MVLTSALGFYRWTHNRLGINLGLWVIEWYFNRNALQFNQFKELFMLHYSVVFLVVALIAAIFGFGGIAAGAVEIAKILFIIFAIMAVITFVIGLIKK